MSETKLTLGDRYDIAEALAKQNMTIDQIARGSGISISQATLWWNRMHPNSFEHSDGLRKTMRDEANWYRECVKELSTEDEQ